MSKFGVLVMGPAGAGKVYLIGQVCHATKLICLDYLLYCHDPAPPTFSPQLFLRQP